MDLNKSIVIGRLTHDIELKSTQSGNQYAMFTLAVGNGKDKDGNERSTDFLNFVVWGKNAENLSIYLHKGNRVAIEGRNKVDKYQNDKGENRYKNYILVERFEFLEPRTKDNFEPNEPDYVKEGPMTGKQVDATPMQNDPFAMFGAINDTGLVEDMDLPF